MTTIIQLTADYADLSAVVTCNGFPVLKADTEDSGFGSAPLNQFLIGKDNVLRVEVTRRGVDARFEAKVEDVHTGDLIETGGGEITLPDGDAPLTVAHHFDAEGDDFAQLLAKARPTDAEAMKAFALRIRDAFNGGDKEGALALFKDRFTRMAALYGHPLDLVMKQVQQLIDSFCSHKQTFEADDVNAVGWCDNKLWQLLDNDGNALFRIEDGDGGVMSLDVAVAQLEDGPAVVL